MIFVFGKLGLIDLEIFEIKKSSIKISDSNNESGWDLFSKVEILEATDTKKHKKMIKICKVQIIQLQIA